MEIVKNISCLKVSGIAVFSACFYIGQHMSKLLFDMFGKMIVNRILKARQLFQIKMFRLWENNKNNFS